MKGIQDPRKKLSSLLSLDIPNYDILEPSLKTAFSILVDEPSYSVTVLVPNYNYEFLMSPIREFEERLIAERTANFDVMTRQIIRRVEALTFAIIGAKTPDGNNFSFLTFEEKIALKQILLSLPTPVIDYLYAAFEKMMAKYREKIREILGGSPEEVLTRGFFQENLGDTEGNEFQSYNG
jgi:hypothetical protein